MATGKLPPTNIARNDLAPHLERLEPPEAKEAQAARREPLVRPGPLVAPALPHVRPRPLRIN